MGQVVARERRALVDGNPIIRHKFTADPTAIVDDDVVYLYTGHDEAPPGTHEYVMDEWLCFASRDLVHWTEHPVPLRASDFAWASGKAYASKVVQYDGSFYWFVSVADRNGDSAIGVAIAPTAVGPFVDLLGHPLVRREDLPDSGDPKSNLDPTVIVVDGSARHGPPSSAPNDRAGLAPARSRRRAAITWR